MLTIHFNNAFFLLGMFGFMVPGVILLQKEEEIYKLEEIAKTEQIRIDNRNQEEQRKNEIERRKINEFKKTPDYVLVSKLIEKYPHRFDNWATLPTYYDRNVSELINQLKLLLDSKGYDLDLDLLEKIACDAKMHEEYNFFKLSLDKGPHDTLYDIVQAYHSEFPEETHESQILLKLYIQDNSIHVNDQELQKTKMQIANDNFESSLFT